MSELWHDVPAERRPRSKPRPEEDASARLQIADARGAYFRPERLGQLLQQRGCLAGFALVFRGRRDLSPLVLGWGWNSADHDLILEWAGARLETYGFVHRAHTGIVVFGVRNDGVIDVATWGQDAQDCKKMGEAGRLELAAITVTPFQTWWGWSNGGIAKRLSGEELDSLSDNQREYVKYRTHPSAVD